jgi:DNA-directed RNA polymerase subunit RPC12/RpoP
MIGEVRIARGFGAQDKPPCANCGSRTFLTRRSPAAEDALEYEQQTFTCSACGRQFERTVDAAGKTIRLGCALARS